MSNNIHCIDVYMYLFFFEVLHLYKPYQHLLSTKLAQMGPWNVSWFFSIHRNNQEDFYQRRNLKRSTIADLNGPGHLDIFYSYFSLLNIAWRPFDHRRPYKGIQFIKTIFLILRRTFYTHSRSCLTYDLCKNAHCDVFYQWKTQNNIQFPKLILKAY